jgi:arginine deiminase
MLEELLFDDILYGDRAREEHAQFRRVMQILGIEVVDASDLLAEALEQGEARDWIANVVLGRLPEKRREALRDLPAVELASAVVGGLRQTTGDCPEGLPIHRLYEVPPLPNWCFQRDPQIVFHDSVLIGTMAAAARHPEALLSRALFRYHPSFDAVKILTDPVSGNAKIDDPTDPTRATLEGGDVLILSERVVAVGLSERTNPAGIRRLARNLAQREDGPRALLVVSLPRRRAYMHLDTLFTQADHDVCLVHAPVILPGGVEQADVYEIDLADPDFAERSRGDLLSALKHHGLDLEPISCGGADPIAQQREQWTDGANTLALAPGLITLFDRNRATADELDRRGFRVLHAAELLLGKTEIDFDRPGKLCILLPSHEISRARGGPHCLVHPLIRDDPA